MSTHDGPGSRLVLFFQGCRLDCSWCHAPHSLPRTGPLLFFEALCISCGRCAEVCPKSVHRFSSGRHLLNRSDCTRCGTCIESCPRSSPQKYSGALQLPTRQADAHALFRHIAPHLDLLKNVGGVTFSGGEPLLQYAELATLARLCKEDGVHVALETSGIVSPQSISALKPYVDLWLVGMRLSTGTDTFDSDFLEAATRRTLDILCAPPRSSITVRIPAILPISSDETYRTKAATILNDFSVSQVEILPQNPASTLFYDAMGITPAPQCRYDPDVAEAQYQSLKDYFEQKCSQRKPYQRRIDHGKEIVTSDCRVAREPR